MRVFKFAYDESSDDPELNIGNFFITAPSKTTTKITGGDDTLNVDELIVKIGDSIGKTVEKVKEKVEQTVGEEKIAEVSEKLTEVKEKVEQTVEDVINSDVVQEMVSEVKEKVDDVINSEVVQEVGEKLTEVKEKVEQTVQEAKNKVNEMLKGGISDKRAAFLQYAKDSSFVDDVIPYFKNVYTTMDYPYIVRDDSETHNLVAALNGLPKEIYVKL